MVVFVRDLCHISCILMHKRVWQSAIVATPPDVLKYVQVADVQSTDSTSCTSSGVVMLATCESTLTKSFHQDYLS